MRTFLFGFFVWVGLIGTLCAVDLPFPIGEELTYSIKWNGVPVAWTRVTTQMETLENREVLVIRLRTQTYAFFNKVYRVDDLHETLIDPETFLPIQYTKNVKEGRYRCHEVTTFNHETLKASYEHMLNGKKKVYDIEPDTRDLISFMYFLRSKTMGENETAEFRVMADEKIYDLILHSSEIEKISLDNYKKKVRCLELRPDAKFEGLFVRKGKADLWISRDPRRLLTYTKVKVPFGKARIKLESVRGPGDDFWITKNKKKESK